MVYSSRSSENIQIFVIKILLKMLSNNMAAMRKNNKSRVNLCFLATNDDTWSFACGIWCAEDYINIMHKNIQTWRRNFTISDVIFRKFNVHKSADMY